MANRQHRILFGDIHNHNACGYGIGSMERSIDVARSHLDFFAFTGHSSWHDMQPMEGGRECHWLKGFQRLKDQWPRVQTLIEDANRPGEFVSFLGFEWHSSRFGDQCVVFPDDHQPLFYPDNVQDLRSFCREKQALMIPHHLAYPQGRRGVNWSVFADDCTPVVEIFSEHGNAEDDRGPFDFFTHSMGGRQTSNTAREALMKGLQFGFVASTDSHNGFPGAYGEGLMACLAADLNRRSIFEAIKARRTYALTGDRIELDFSVDGAPMGSSIQAGHSVEVAFDVRGRDEMDAVEIVQDGHVVHRAYPRTDIDLQKTTARPFQLRLEWGWGPWGDLALDRVCDWEFEIIVDGARLHRIFPCLQSGPFDEHRRHRFTRIGDNRVHVVSYSARRGAYRLNPNQSVILELEGGPEATVGVRLIQPSERSDKHRIAELFAGSAHFSTGPFPQESYQWHRLVPQASSRVVGECSLEPSKDRGFIYLRAKQRNGHMAWASPVFLRRN